MENINLSSIKRESVKAIYNSIASSNKISRAQISEQTGLSLMTVGKVVEALLNYNIIKQSKEVKTAAGRKAGLISTNSGNFCVIIDLTSVNFSMVIVNVRLEPVDQIKYNYNIEMFYENNLMLFLYNVKMFLEKNYNMDECIGYGVSLPGPYNAATDTMMASRIYDLMNLHIKEIITNVFETNSIYIESSVNVAAISNVTKIADYKNKTILYWFIGDYIAGTVVVNGEIMHGSHNVAGDFGQTIVSYGKTLDAAIKDCAEMQNAAHELGKTLYNVIKIIDPDVIILEYEIFGKSPEFFEALKDALLNHYHLPASFMPEIISGGCNIRHSQRGLAMKLREKWLDSVIK